ncbi:hypothetical protein J4734_04275 [Klebsiella pneumoniae]|uniref:Uncharacterized protein n=1 Tax=Klebsiella pneumoniae TaxID=573 RepID=A0A939NRR0_KLEPN|nr:hypothetical protein [Klebsiella pneumoniae]
MVRIRCRPTPNSRRSAKRSTIWNWLSSGHFMTKTASAADVILPSTSWASTKACIPQRTAASSAS